MSQPFDQTCKLLRTQIKEIAKEVLAAHDVAALYHPEDISPLEPVHNLSEMHANLTLAYRHLEDAAMRLGKAIQAFDGGQSVYDK
jgi:hypothetical protein